MNVLLNFRYLTMGKIDKYVVREVTNSNELEYIVDDFKFYADSIRDFDGNIENYFLKSNGSINSVKVKNTKIEIQKICGKRIEEYNQRLEKSAYLFLDEICTIFIKHGKAIPMEDVNEYVNYNDVKRLTQEAILNIADHDEDFDLSSYVNVLYLVYIDIIKKGTPLLIFQNSF